jgi:hypothetical protein
LSAENGIPPLYRNKRNKEKALFNKLISVSMELEALKGKAKNRRGVRAKIAELKSEIRYLRANYIKAAARLDRSRAKLGIKARCVEE